MKPKIYFEDRLAYWMDKIKDYKMSDEERIAQAKSWVYGNCKLSNPYVTRELVDEIFEARAKKRDKE